MFPDTDPGAILRQPQPPEGWREALELLRRTFPEMRWLLVGDDGQHDPEIYGRFCAAHPDRVAAVAIRVQEPVFESQTKTKLGSTDIGPKGPSVRDFIGKFVQQSLDVYLHKNPETADAILRRIQESEHERKELAGIRSIARERAKKASLHNRKLRDCRLHLGDRGERAEESSLFIVEGDSAAGSLTACRDVQTQAVFALKGKPLNTYGLSKKVIYENEEFHLLQSALNIEEGLDGLRYNKIVIATDADVDGMHIRLLLISFFLQYFPDLIRNGHLYVGAPYSVAKVEGEGAAAKIHKNSYSFPGEQASGIESWLYPIQPPN